MVWHTYCFMPLAAPSATAFKRRITCVLVRYYVAKYTAGAAEAYARRNGGIGSRHCGCTTLSAADYYCTGWLMRYLGGPDTPPIDLDHCRFARQVRLVPPHRLRMPFAGMPEWPPMRAGRPVPPLAWAAKGGFSACPKTRQRHPNHSRSHPTDNAIGEARTGVMAGRVCLTKNDPKQLSHDPRKKACDDAQHQCFISR
jgi:hypothetical protein